MLLASLPIHPILLFQFLFIVFISIIVYYWHACDETVPKKDDNSDTTNNLETIELLPAEQNKWIYAPGVNSITFYEGDINSTLVQKRLIKILLSNPWLTSRLITQKWKYFIQYNRVIMEEQSIQDHFLEILIDNNTLSENLAPFDENSSIETLFHYLEKHLIPPAKQSCNQPKAVLFRIIMVKMILKGEKEITKTAFIPSISHVIADGYSFYQIYKMFHYQNKIITLNPYRVYDFHSRYQERIGKDIFNFLQSPLLIMSALWKKIISVKPKIFNFQINKNRIEILKKALQQNYERANAREEGRSTSIENLIEIPFLSTNDILTSWFFRQVKVNYGFMAVNFRNRIEGILDSLAGNYEGVLFYSKKGYSEPHFIRKSLITSRPEFPSVPTFLQTIEFNFGLVTNWSSFYEEVLLEEDHQLISHAPLMTNSDVLMNLLIIYSPRKGELGAYILSREIHNINEWYERGDFLSAVSTKTEEH